jgi:hypothetical protein
MLVRFSGAGFNFAAADLDFVLVSLISVRPIEQTILAESALPRWQGNPCKAGQAYGCRGSVIVGNKFLGLRVGPRTIAQTGVHKIYTGSGLRRVTPYVQFVQLCYLR